MNTDALIARLSERAAPIGPGAAPRILLIGIGGGAAVSAAAMLLWLGLRPDLVAAMASGMYWMKFSYTLLFAACAFWTVERLSRPGAPSRPQMILEALPFAAVAALALLRLVLASPQARVPMMMGHSAHVCPWRIAVLSLPILAGALWSLKRLAPTRPAAAGAAAGLLAGAAGAFIYAFHCDESAMAFVAVWYSFGILLAGAAGAAAGRLLLRW